MVEDPISDVGGPRFESQTGRLTGKQTPSLWRDKRPAVKGLRPPEHHAGQFHLDLKTPPSPKTHRKHLRAAGMRGRALAFKSQIRAQNNFQEV